MNSFTKYSDKKISKIGNTIRFLTQNKGESKTKILKLVYLLEELSIKKFGIPFFNISFQVWKFGPVAEPIFIEISSSPSMFSDYIKINHTSTGSTIQGKGDFDDFYFSDNDVDLLEYVLDNYGSLTAKDLIKITHRKNSPWYNEASRRGILNELLNEEITNTHYTINLSELIESDLPMKKEMYFDYLELNGSPNLESDEVHNLTLC